MIIIRDRAIARVLFFLVCERIFNGAHLSVGYNKNKSCTAFFVIYTGLSLFIIVAIGRNKLVKAHA